jgi:hypothetical protein
MLTEHKVRVIGMKLPDFARKTNMPVMRQAQINKSSKIGPTGNK